VIPSLRFEQPFAPIAAATALVEVASIVVLSKLAQGRVIAADTQKKLDREIRYIGLAITGVVLAVNLHAAIFHGIRAAFVSLFIIVLILRVQVKLPLFNTTG
jgi:hypothetical protein